MTIFQLNKRRGILFIPSGVTFGFCMARITTFIMRIVWAKNPTNAGIAIAASIFVGAGVLLLMLVNMLYTQRVMRGYHPRFGHRREVNWAFRAWYGSIVATLVMFIITGVYSMYTLEPGPLLKMRGKSCSGSLDEIHLLTHDRCPKILYNLAFHLLSRSHPHRPHLPLHSQLHLKSQIRHPRPSNP